MTGIFHLDSLSARDVFFKFRPKNFSELIVFLGLNRPIARNLCYEITKIKFSSDLKKTKFYEDENINGLLKESYGFVIFQEQVTQILALVYQISFAKAEKIRKENFKDIDYSKIKEKLQLFKLTNLQKNFLANSLTSSFNYAFNKSHAVAYAYLVYFVAYIKANFFPQIIIHLLEEKREKAIDYIEEAAYCGFFIAKPDINFSLLKSHLGADNTIRLGFSFLPIFKKEIFEKIIVERDKNGLFKSFQDFIDREYKELIKIKKEELKS